MTPQRHRSATETQKFFRRGSLCLCGFLWFCGVGVVEAALEFSTDHRPVAFGMMRLGEEKILAQSGTSHNQITCSSTDGQAWYLKVNVLQPLSSGAETIPLEQFQWWLTSTNGHGSEAHPNAFTPFSLMPDTVYLSSPDEVSGTSVTFQLRYQLKIPEHQVSGVYSTTIRFTLTELL